ncbi:hypothetical protein P9139_04920 [Curtobacterium flaccumfaciens]|nr:hypothetical protein P9139_04920 [Curtobacterium flaccumfaciens]
MIGLVVIVVVVLFCFVGPFLYPTDQTHTQLSQVNLAPAPPTCSAPTPSATTSSGA